MEAKPDFLNGGFDTQEKPLVSSFKMTALRVMWLTMIALTGVLRTMYLGFGNYWGFF